MESSGKQEARDDQNDEASEVTALLSQASKKSLSEQDEDEVQPPTTVLGRVEEMIEAVQEVVGEINDAVVEELQEIKENFVDELHRADDEEDKYFVLDMGLARSLSVLPGDIADAANLFDPGPQPTAACHVDDPCTIFPELVVTTAQDSDQFLTKGNIMVSLPDEAPLSSVEAEKERIKAQAAAAKPTNIPVSAYLLLASAVICLSSTGPFFNIQRDVDAVMKIFWRTSATNVVLLPLAIYGIFKEGFPKLETSQWIMVFVAGLAYSSLGIFFVMSLDYTTVGNAMILNNSQAILLILGKFFVGERVTRVEFAGASVAFMGAVMCSIDAAENDPKEKLGTGIDGKTLLGDLFALISAIGGVGYLVFAQSVRSHLNLYIFMFFNMFQNSVYALTYIILSGQVYTVDFDTFHGLFAWLLPRSDRLLVTVVAVILCNFLGVMGYIRAMHYFDKLVISVAGLMEPVVATLLAYSLSVGLLPGWKGWIGNALVAGGTFAVIYQPSNANGAASTSTNH